jgi:hypothetical protein
MATQAPRSFRRSARKQEARPVTAFTLDWVQDLTEEEEAQGIEPEVIRSDTFHATMPTDERLFLVAALIGDDDNPGAEAAGVMELLRDILPASEFRTLKGRLADTKDSVDMDVIQEVLEWLMEKWSTFPTERSAASSKSPTSTGTKSTGRVRGQGSTHSPSPSIAS